MLSFSLRRLALLLACASGIFVSSASAAPAHARPNIVLILADDLGYSDLGCFGSEIATPHLDRLAAGGLTFTQFYNTARCCPTRAALLTGLYPHQAGVGHMVETMGKPIPYFGFPAYRAELSDRAVTIAEALRAAGYHTAMAGKWHLTPFTDSKVNWPLQRGFEKFYGIIDGFCSYFDPTSLTRDNDAVKPEGKDYYLTDAIGENAERYIAELARQPQPFFLYVAFTAPHWPLHARPEDIAKYEGKYLQGWDALREARHRRQIELGLVDPAWPLSPRDKSAPAWDGVADKAWQAHRMAVFAAQVDRLDQRVGKILAQLRETGADQNTLVLFLSDNGGCAENLGARRPGGAPPTLPGGPDTYASYGGAWANASNTPFRLYKHWLHEGGISTPLIASRPGTIAAGGRTRQTGHVIDLMATCLDLSGAPYPQTYHGKDIVPLEGLSLAPIFRGGTRAGHPFLAWEHEGNRAIRQGPWKLVSRFPGDWELYNVETDRTELKNLAGENPAKARELVTAYDAWAQRVGVVPWELYRDKLDAVKKAK